MKGYRVEIHRATFIVGHGLDGSYRFYFDLQIFRTEDGPDACSVGSISVGPDELEDTFTRFGQEAPAGWRDHLRAAFEASIAKRGP